MAGTIGIPIRLHVDHHETARRKTLVCVYVCFDSKQVNIRIVRLVQAQNETSFAGTSLRDKVVSRQVMPFMPLP